MLARLSLIPLLCSLSWANGDPGLLQVKTVYLLPMGNGLDQYLANQLTQEQVFKVVTDPATADAIITDRLGPTFEQAFVDLYPPPAPPEAPAPVVPEGKKPVEKTTAELLGEGPATPARVSTFSRGRGNVFLVDRKSRQVLWSSFERPRNSRPQEVNRTADRLVDQLEGSLKDLRKGQK